MSNFLRIPTFPILSLLVERYSPRGFSGAPVQEEEMMSIFEAARWAPSSYNDQPWRFFYTMAGDGHWADFFDLLVPANQDWARAAGALVIITSSMNFEKTGQFSPSHSYDTGAAAQNMALQAHSMGLRAHSIAGFDYARARDLICLPDTYAVEAMMAIGHCKGSVSKYSQRKPLEEFVYRGRFVK